MGAAIGAAYYGSDLSTVDPNPSIFGGADTSTMQDISTIANTAGQWGATIASVITGNPVAVTNQGQVVGAVGSQVVAPAQFSGTSMILLLAVVVVVILLVKE